MLKKKKKKKKKKKNISEIFFAFFKNIPFIHEWPSNKNTSLCESDFVNSYIYIYI